MRDIRMDVVCSESKRTLEIIKEQLIENGDMRADDKLTITNIDRDA